MGKNRGGKGNHDNVYTALSLVWIFEYSDNTCQVPEWKFDDNCNTKHRLHGTKNGYYLVLEQDWPTFLLVLQKMTACVTVSVSYRSQRVSNFHSSFSTATKNCKQQITSEQNKSPQHVSARKKQRANQLPRQKNDIQHTHTPASFISRTEQTRQGWLCLTFSWLTLSRGLRKQHQIGNEQNIIFFAPEHFSKSILKVTSDNQSSMFTVIVPYNLCERSEPLRVGGE